MEPFLFSPMYMSNAQDSTRLDPAGAGGAPRPCRSTGHYRFNQTSPCLLRALLFLPAPFGYSLFLIYLCINSTNKNLHLHCNPISPTAQREAFWGYRGTETNPSQRQAGKVLICPWASVRARCLQAYGHDGLCWLNGV